MIWCQETPCSSQLFCGILPQLKVYRAVFAYQRPGRLSFRRDTAGAETHWVRYRAGQLFPSCGKCKENVEKI